MERTLAENPRAILALEYMPEAMRELGFEAPELLGWLRERDFRAYRIEKVGNLQATQVDLSPGPGYVDLLWSREFLVA